MPLENIIKLTKGFHPIIASHQRGQGLFFEVNDIFHLRKFRTVICNSSIERDVFKF